MTAPRDSPLALPPLVLTLTTVVVPAIRSRMKTSLHPLVSWATRSPARLSKSANRPSAEMAAGKESPLPPPVPAKFMLTRWVVLLVRLRKNTFMHGGNGARIGVLLAISERLFATLLNNTKPPSGPRMGATESPPPPAGGGMVGSATETSCRALTPARLSRTAAKDTDAACQRDVT